eukprot:TRINITY_DN13162_c0_g1_i1.p1 TRINITY_DN13162_c0_g1~~TRINITY_DN13162_c0_g1_i1.p1  ORF type:complete len:197 (+),score=27.86 TRINITY_DN13162_c0_g1_i1:90-680(+)
MPAMPPLPRGSPKHDPGYPRDVKDAAPRQRSSEVGVACASSSASASPPPPRGVCTFSVTPRPASEPSSARRAAAAAAAAAAEDPDEPPVDRESIRRVLVERSAWAGDSEPAASQACPPPSGAAPSKKWRHTLETLQREYSEALKSIDARLNERLARLNAQLENSRKHELPPSYPPSDASRPETEPEVVETDPECSP